MNRMETKVAVARILRTMSETIFRQCIDNWDELTPKKRSDLMSSSDSLAEIARHVLRDALEEGTARAEDLTGRLGEAEEKIKETCKDIDKVKDVLNMAAKVLKVAAAVISVGVPEAAALADKLLG